MNHTSISADAVGQVVLEGVMGALIMQVVKARPDEFKAFLESLGPASTSRAMDDGNAAGEATGGELLMGAGPAAGQSVDAVELRMDVDAKINKAKSFQKIINRSHFLAVADNAKVHILTTFEVVDHSDPQRWTAPSLDGGRPDPLSDFGIKVGCIVTGLEMRLHAVRSILRGRMWKAMLKHPRRTWKFLVWHSAPFFSIGGDA